MAFFPYIIVLFVLIFVLIFVHILFNISWTRDKKDRDTPPLI